MKPSHFYGALLATVLAHFAIQIPIAFNRNLQGRLFATTDGPQHQLESTWTKAATFATANVLALRHYGPNGAAAIALQDERGRERGAVGYKNDTGVSTYLNGAVYLAGGAYDASGQPLTGSPTPVIIGQEGTTAKGQPALSARLTFGRDWSITWADHMGGVHTTVSEPGEWSFRQPITATALAFAGSAPHPRLGTLKLAAGRGRIVDPTVTENTQVFLCRRGDAGSPASYSVQPGEGITIVGGGPEDSGVITWLFVDLVP